MKPLAHSLVVIIGFVYSCYAEDHRSILGLAEARCELGGEVNSPVLYISSPGAPIAQTSDQGAGKKCTKSR